MAQVLVFELFAVLADASPIVHADGVVVAPDVVGDLGVLDQFVEPEDEHARVHLVGA